jgi:hypothetical protein
MFKRDRNTDDFTEEIRSHLELEADELRSEGLSEEEAHRKARVAFGNVAAVKERFHMRNRALWFENLLRDINFRDSPDRQESRLRRRHHPRARSRHRRVHFHLLCGRCGAAPSSALSES